MKTVRVHTVILLSALLLGSTLSWAQSGRQNRKSSVMRGNLVKTVFGNWGVIGQPADKGARGAWIHENNGYIGDVSLMVGAEVESDGQTFHSVVVCPINRPTRQHEQSPTGQYWGFEPVAGYFNPNQQSVALFSDPNSWPLVWPDKMNDAEDPGWSGSWNGFFGKTTTASEESYFVMDDNNDKEFNYAENNKWNVAFKPDSTNPTRNGLGLEVKVRGMQWSDFLAQDCIFWLYEITNTGTTDYSKVSFGMLAGTYVGVTSSDDAHREYDDDYSFFDVEKDLTYTGDFDDDASANPRWTGEVGIVGYAFLESPGNPFDGIDNDGDAQDGLGVGGSAPQFEASSFDPRLINVGDEIVIIDRNYERTVRTVTATDTLIRTRGGEIKLTPGSTELAEGNVVIRDGVEAVNPNAYDGIDNDLDGLVDENFFLHYRQLRRDTNGNILIDKLAPVSYVDYFSGFGMSHPLIDERRDDGIDNDGDWNAEFDDVGADGLIGTNDRGEGDGMPTTGEPNFDRTDVDESDQIGLTSFEYFAPANEFSMADDEELWDRMAPGYFKVPESIVNNKPERGEDGDFIYGSGYFPLRAGETKYFSLALVYGEGGGPEVEIEDLLNNRETVQKIYDSDYRFPPAPLKPTLKAVPGDGKVTLYWDRRAENSLDPVLKTYDFEGYKIYKATDQNFNDVFEVTDADGTPVAYTPLVQYDLNNDIEGYFYPSGELFQQSRGTSFNLGSDTGLRHSYVDNDVENGRRYFYAVVAYDRGDSELDIFPKENDKRIDVLPSGEVQTFQNTAMVVPNDQVAGYVPPEGSIQLQSTDKVGTGAVYYTVVDESALNGHQYQVEFWDTSNDGIDNNDDEFNRIDEQDLEEWIKPITTSYSVRDMTGVTVTFGARDTIFVRLPHQHLIEGTVVLRDSEDQTVDPTLYELDLEEGRIRGVNSNDLLYGENYTITYQYYPVFRSPYIQKSPYVEETRDTDIFDGIQLSFNNHWNTRIDTLNTRWSNPDKAMGLNLYTYDGVIGTDQLQGIRKPSDYRIEFSDDIADTTLDKPEWYVFGTPVTFRVFNVTEQRYIEFVFLDIDMNEKVTPFDEIYFFEPNPADSLVLTWSLNFISEETYSYGDGDTLHVRLKKPFRRGDTFSFMSEPAQVDNSMATTELEGIRVVPNPYVTATAHERPLPPAITTGRGERKIDFIHLPAGADIHIFTARGEHVTSLHHDDNIFDGTVSWNLKSKENLDVAAGIYFYVVESDVGVKKGKIAIIK